MGLNTVEVIVWGFLIINKDSILFLFFVSVLCRFFYLWWWAGPFVPHWCGGVTSILPLWPRCSQQLETPPSFSPPTVHIHLTLPFPMTLYPGWTFLSLVIWKIFFLSLFSCLEGINSEPVINFVICSKFSFFFRSFLFLVYFQPQHSLCCLERALQQEWLVACLQALALQLCMWWQLGSWRLLCPQHMPVTGACVWMAWEVWSLAWWGRH